MVTFHEYCILRTYTVLRRGSGNRNGTCFTTTECADRSGSAQGNCAAGYIKHFFKKRFFSAASTDRFPAN